MLHVINAFLYIYFICYLSIFLFILCNCVYIYIYIYSLVARGCSARFALQRVPCSFSRNSLRVICFLLYLFTCEFAQSSNFFVVVFVLFCCFVYTINLFNSTTLAFY